MRVLIAITSCVKFALNGSNQASRDTWMKALPHFPSVSCRFFIGDGTPNPEDETFFQKSLADCPHVKLDNPRVSLDDPNPYAPKEDEVVVHSPDDYIYHTSKTREMLRWALKQGFDFIFMAAGDTYIDLQRLLSSGFENHDYTGRQYGHFAVGGSGYWLSRRAAQHLVDEFTTDWATDRWIGSILLEKHGIEIHGDQRYGASPEQNPGLANPSPLFPLQDNDQITAHLAEAPGHYHHSLMYKAHELRGQNGLNERPSNDSSARIRLAPAETLCDIPSPVRIQGHKADACSECIGDGQKEPDRPRVQPRGLRPRRPVERLRNYTF